MKVIIPIFRSESEDEDMEEKLFQCEICQIITNTKVEFIEHIEENHSDIVDEEVLLSLKSDIRKSKKENGASEAPPLPPPQKLSSCSNITKFEFKPLYGYIIDPFNNCDVIDIILKYLKDLKELVIWNCDWNASSIGVDGWCLTQTSRTQNTLKKLVLKQCALDTKHDVHFEEIVGTFPNLEELHIDHFSGRNYCFQTENLEGDLDTLSQLRNLKIIKFTGLYEMGDSESRIDNLGVDSEDEDDNEIFVRELKMAQWTLCKQFHIDSEVEIDIAQPDDRLDGTVLKAVLIKKKGFYPALLPPWISVDHSAGL